MCANEIKHGELLTCIYPPAGGVSATLQQTGSSRADCNAIPEESCLFADTSRAKGAVLALLI